MVEEGLVNLSPELLEKARVELNEVPSEVQSQITSLRMKIAEKPKWNFRTDDPFLIRFLRARKFHQDRTLELIVNYYTERDKNPQFFKKTVQELQNALTSKYQGVLKTRDKNGSAIMVFFAHRWNPDVYSLEDLIANIVLSLECIVEEEDIQINGLILIVDLKGLNAKQTFNTSPRTIKRTYQALFNSFPIRYKAVHFVNEPYIFSAFFSLMKSLSSKKLLSRIHLHGNDLGCLHSYFDPDLLPGELGGRKGPYDNSEWNETLKEHETVVLENLKYGFQVQ